VKRLMLIVGAFVVSGLVWGYSVYRTDVFKTGHPLEAESGPLELIDADFSTEQLPAGWAHRTFFRITPTDYQIVEEDGRRAMRCTSDNSGSILARETAIAVAKLPILSWSWKITQAIDKRQKSSGAIANTLPATTKSSAIFITWWLMA